MKTYLIQWKFDSCRTGESSQMDARNLRQAAENFCVTNGYRIYYTYLARCRPKGKPSNSYVRFLAKSGNILISGTVLPA